MDGPVTSEMARGRDHRALSGDPGRIRRPRLSRHARWCVQGDVPGDAPALGGRDAPHSAQQPAGRVEPARPDRPAHHLTPLVSSCLPSYSDGVWQALAAYFALVGLRVLLNY